MKIRTLAKVFAAGLIATSMAAALPMGVSADTAEAPAATQSAQTIRFAKVTAVSASSITVAFGEDQRPEKKEKPAAAADGQLPTPPADNSDAQGSRPARKERPASTDADTAADKVQKKDKTANFVESGETAVIDLNGITIMKDGQAASAADITEGDIITVVYTNGTVTEIKSGHPHGSKGGKFGRGGRKAGRKDSTAPDAAVTSTATV